MLPEEDQEKYAIRIFDVGPSSWGSGVASSDSAAGAGSGDAVGSGAAAALGAQSGKTRSPYQSVHRLALKYCMSQLLSFKPDTQRLYKKPDSQLSGCLPPIVHRPQTSASQRALNET